MQATTHSDIQLIGHLQGIFDASAQGEFRSENTWRHFCERTLMMKPAQIPIIDFSQRNVWVLCNKIEYKSTNYIGVIRSERDPATKQLFIECCNIVEESGRSVMGFCKIVVSIPKKDQLNVLWRGETPAERLDKTLNRHVAEYKRLSSLIFDNQYAMNQSQDKYFRRDTSSISQENEVYKTSMAEEAEEVKKVRSIVKERLAGPCLNKA